MNIAFRHPQNIRKITVIELHRQRRHLIPKPMNLFYGLFLRLMENSQTLQFHHLTMKFSANQSVILIRCLRVIEYHLEQLSENIYV